MCQATTTGRDARRSNRYFLLWIDVLKEILDDVRRSLTEYLHVRGWWWDGRKAGKIMNLLTFMTRLETASCANVYTRTRSWTGIRAHNQEQTAGEWWKRKEYMHEGELRPYKVDVGNRQVRGACIHQPAVRASDSVALFDPAART